MMTNFVRLFLEDLAQGRPLHRPPVVERFNWVRDVFEALHVRQRPDRVMLQLGDHAPLTYASAAQQADGLLVALRSRAPAGATAVVMSGLHPGIWVSYLALIKGGYRIVPAAHNLTVEDLVFRFRAHPPQLVIADRSCQPRIDAALERTQLSPARLGLEDLPGWTWIQSLPDPTAGVPTEDTGYDDPLFLFFTSGTTGMPKVVVHSHSSYPLGHLSTLAWLGLSPDDIHENIAQPGWAKFAWSSFFAPLTVGCQLRITPHPGKFDAPYQLSCLQRTGVTSLCAPPTALRLLVQEDLSRYHLKLRQCVSAGEPLNPEVIEAWKRGTGLTLRDGYGQSETTLMVCNPPGQPIRPGSMGKPSFLYDVVIASEEGTTMAAGEVGQIAVRLKSGEFRGVFSGYASGQAANPFRHGLYYTGDKAYQDEDGYIWFVGRDDDVIKTSDYRVGPFEVESALIEHPAVVEAGVVGVPHPIRGQQIKAYLTLAAGAEAGPELARQLFDHCQHRLASYQRPRKLQFVQELPKTTSGKIRRVELRHQPPSGIEYDHDAP